MKDQVINVEYASSLTGLCNLNSSFDSGTLRICYPGLNRNKTFISEEALCNATNTLFNCPLVTNYDRESDTLGGHDTELVEDSNGNIKLVNVTQPIGVIPESARVWREDVTEENGEVHNYLCTDVLLWKRQEAYEKIKADGVSAHSMEISVKKGHLNDGVFYIDDFEFTALTLIGVTPCFESSALETFSKKDFKKQLSEMMQDLKDCYKKDSTSYEDKNKHPQKEPMEGGIEALEQKMEILKKYNVSPEDLDFSIEEISEEALDEKLAELYADADKAEEGHVEEAGAAEADPIEEPAAEADEEGEEKDPKENNFSLTSGIVDELYRCLSEVTVSCEWGECRRYAYVDCDFDLQEVYCYDTNDWLLYGMKYTLDGDNVSIDFDSQKRKKFVISDFDEGESAKQGESMGAVFSEITEKLSECLKYEEKYEAANSEAEKLNQEVIELRSFKKEVEKKAREEACEELFAKFSDLSGIDAFEELRDSHDDIDLDTIEEKCFAIRGRNYSATAKFSASAPKNPKLGIIKTETNKNVSNEPYGGIFVETGVVNAE